MVQVYASGGDITGWPLYALEGIGGVAFLLILAAVIYFTPKAVRYAAKEETSTERAITLFLVCAAILCAIAVEVLIAGGITGYIH